MSRKAVSLVNDISEAQITELGDRHKIPAERITEPDPRARYKVGHSKTLAEAVYEAAFAYRAFRLRQHRGYDGPDTLLEIDKPAAALIRLLSDPVNEQRLAADELHGRAIINRLDDVLAFLEDIRAAAARVHQPTARGRPPNDELDAAYRVLADWYRQEYGDDAFTRGWEPTEHGLAPTSPAACFLFDAMKLIDAERLNLAGSLNRLMEDTVKPISGPRRGRKSKT